MRSRLKAALLLLPLLAGGCVTHKLWTESRLDEWNEPAGNPNLRLFRGGPQNSVLVVYDEFSERHETTRARAFVICENQKPPPPQSRPHFVNAKAAGGLAPVPVFSSPPTNWPEFFYAVTETNGGGFTVFSGGRQAGSYQLPVYKDRTGELEKIAWTPVAATADLTIIGGWLGCLWIYTGGPGLNR